MSKHVRFLSLEQQDELYTFLINVIVITLLVLCIPIFVIASLFYFALMFWLNVGALINNRLNKKVISQNLL